MTDAERLLWSKLRRKQLKGLQIYRQRIIGNYTLLLQKDKVELTGCPYKQAVSTIFMMPSESHRLRDPADGIDLRFIPHLASV